MRWFFATLISSILSSFFVILGIFEIWKNESEKDRIFKVLSLRENVVRVLNYYGKDNVQTTSYLNLSTTLASQIGDESLVALLDSLKNAVSVKNVKKDELEKLERKIRERAERILTGGKRELHWLYVTLGAFFALLSALLSLLGFLEFRRSLRILRDILQDLRLGIVWEKVEMVGDFKVLEGSLNGLLKDVKRIRRNVQKVVRA